MPLPLLILEFVLSLLFFWSVLLVLVSELLVLVSELPLINSHTPITTPKNMHIVYAVKITVTGKLDFFTSGLIVGNRVSCPQSEVIRFCLTTVSISPKACVGNCEFVAEPTIRLDPSSKQNCKLSSAYTAWQFGQCFINVFTDNR